jgi:hypothetical protein
VAETQLQRDVRDSLGGSYPSAEKMQQIQFHQIHELKTEISLMASLLQWCTIFLAIICAVVVYKAIRG